MNWRALTIGILLALCTLARGEESSAYQFRMLDASQGLPENNVRDVLMLPDGLVCIQTSSWLSLYNGADFRNYRWDPVKVPYTEYTVQNRMEYEPEAGRVILYARGRRWAFDLASREFVYDVPQVFSHIADSLGRILGQGSYSRSETAQSSLGIRWFMSDKQLVRFDPFSGEFREVEKIRPGSDDLFTSIAVDSRDNLWVGTARSGVRIYYSDGSVRRFPYLERIGGKPLYPHLDIARIYADPQGGVWVATQQEGLLYWHPDIIRIRTVNSATLEGGKMDDESVKCLAEAPDGKVLVGTIHGLQRYDPATGRMDAPWPELKDELVIGLFVDSRKRIWAGTFYNGLYCIDGRRVRHYSYPQQFAVDVSYQFATPNLNCVRALTEDAEGRYWISVYGGAGSFDPVTGKIRLLREAHPELDRYMIVRDILPLRSGELIISGDNGRFRYNPANDSLRLPSEVDAFTFTSQVYEDSEGRVWLAESGGLKLLGEDGSARQIIESGTVIGLAEDVSGNLWAMSTNTLSAIRILPDATVYRSDYGREDGIDCGSFFSKSVLRHSDGHLYFGGSSGFCVIDPEAIRLRDRGVPPMISSFTVDGEGRSVSGGTLRYNETSLSFSFTNLNYANPSHSRYRYRLVGFDREWHTVTSSPLGTAAYTFLEPGKYSFEVTASDNGSDWSAVTSVPIEVKPPFWRTRWAYLLYTLLALALVALAVTEFYRRARRRMAEQTAEEQRRQEEELNQMKFRFFTNISHELRTPLSLIILPLESLMKEKEEGSEEYARLDTMHRNAKTLLDMVNHLLDFRRLEMGGEKLQLRGGNFSEFVAGIVGTFQDAAAKKNLRLSLTDSTDNCIMAFDSTMMQKVINNLLSNAMKFTPDGGIVEVRLSETGDGSMRLEVCDSGIGIPEADLDHIFDRFYRSANASSSTGSGIGLSLVRQYVEMHGGSVTVSSESGKGSVFTVILPKAQAEQGDIAEPGEETSVEVQPAAGERKCIMVVDDNADFRHYLRDELSRSYRVSTAADGEDCLRKLPSLSPDIIVCDVMMPKMNGFELTRRIKENLETSHIPVILLSARMSEDIRTKGYDCGADSYLSKPFRMEMLEARIRNLLEDREKRIRSFSDKAEVTPMHLTITTVDQKLMAKIMERLEANMDNVDYSVEDLASDVNMHRMNLYRKIQSLYGMNPTVFIRTVRLKRAAQLLGDDPGLSIVEVSERVGFGTPKYFTRYFKEMFGVLPSQYRKR